MQKAVIKAESEYNCSEGRHQYELIHRVEATATTDGSETYRCVLSGFEYTVIVHATSHLWGEWIVDREPTCTEKGQRHRICTRTANPHREVEVIPALGHDYQLTVIPATCEEAELKTYTCSRCGDTYTESGAAALRHDYQSEITKPATCTEDGIETFVCAHNSDESYTEAILALGHDFGEWQIERSAEEGRAGLEVRICSRCSEREERMIAALPVPEPPSPPPLFNKVDAIVNSVSVGLLILFASMLLSSMKVVKLEKQAYGAYLEREKLKKLQLKKYNFY